MTSDESTSPRPPLTAERVLRAAVELADREGLDALTMRRLGAALDVEAMSLYKHVDNKEAILAGMIELVIGEIDIPSEAVGWREAMRGRAVSARDVLVRHSWAIGLLESRNSLGPAARRYLDAVLGILRSGGFSVENAAHAFWLLDSYVYGHVVQETSLSPGAAHQQAGSTRSIAEHQPVDDYPHLVELERHALRSEYSFDGEFAFGLDLILDALERIIDLP